MTSDDEIERLKINYLNGLIPHGFFTFLYYLIKQTIKFVLLNMRKDRSAL